MRSHSIITSRRNTSPLSPRDLLHLHHHPRVDVRVLHHLAELIKTDLSIIILILVADYYSIELNDIKLEKSCLKQWFSNISSMFSYPFVHCITWYWFLLDEMQDYSYLVIQNDGLVHNLLKLSVFQVVPHHHLQHLKQLSVGHITIIVHVIDSTISFKFNNPFLTQPEPSQSWFIFINI